jgi:uncharacterized protein YlxW (UPF0749 family)
MNHTDPVPDPLRAPGTDPAGLAEPADAPVAPAAPDASTVPGQSYRQSSLWRWKGIKSLLGGGMFAVLGLLLVSGAVAYSSGDVLENSRPDDLVRILSSVESENDRLNQEATELRSELNDLRSGTQAEALAASRRRLEDLEILAGTTPVTGPGIRVIIQDPDGAFAASDMLDTVQELRDAGAESIEVAGQRIVVNTWFTDAPDGGAGIIISGQRRNPPYTILAIGDAQTLATALQIPGGVSDTAQSGGGSVDIGRRESLEIRSTVPMVTPEYAQPAADAG